MKAIPASVFRRRSSEKVAIAVDPEPMTHATATAIKELLTAAGSTGLEANLRAIENLAAIARDNPQAERAREYAERITAKLTLVRQHVQSGNAAQAALEALHLAEVWMQLRVDTTMAAAVWEKKRRRESASTLSDEAILAAIERHKTLKAAARELVLSERQLRDRRKAITGRTS